MTEKALAVMNLQETMSLGETLAKSGYFSDAKGAAQAVVKVLAGQELGFGPIASMTGVHIVQGKPTLGANLMGAAIKRSETYNYRVAILTDQECEIAFFEDGQEVGRSRFTMADAERAGLANKENWKKYPRNMLFSRTLSNGAKWFCPDVFSGVTPYTPEELGAEVDGETGNVIEGQFTVAETEETSDGDGGDRRGSNGGYQRPTHIAEILKDCAENADLEGLEWKQFHEAVVADIGHFKAQKHVVGYLTQELGQNWGQHYTKSELWRVLENHAAERTGPEAES